MTYLCTNDGTRRRSTVNTPLDAKTKTKTRKKKGLFGHSAAALTKSLVLLPHAADVLPLDLELWGFVNLAGGTGGSVM